MKNPGPDHPIAVTPQPGRVRMMLAGVAVADSLAALRLAEGRYPAVLYLPRGDIRTEAFVRSAHTSHCPFKGDATSYDLVVGGTRRPNAVWSYEAPYPAAAAIAGHVAFYPDRVDAIEIA